jgi:hypothetical protein
LLIAARNGGLINARELEQLSARQRFCISERGTPKRREVEAVLNHAKLFPTTTTGATRARRRRSQPSLFDTEGAPNV